jgi:Protein of unknown function (DUF4012)
VSTPGDPDTHLAPDQREREWPGDPDFWDKPSVDGRRASRALRNGRRPRGPIRRRGPRRHVILKGAFAFGALLLVGLGIVLADAYYQSYAIYRDVEAVVPTMRQAADHLGKGELPAGDPFGRAARAVGRATRAVDHARITFRIAGGIPFLGRPVTAVRHGVAAAGAATEAALVTQKAVVDLLGEAARKPGSLRAAQTPVFRGGVVDVKLLEGLGPTLDAVITHLRTAEREIRAIPSIPLVPRLDEVKRQGLTDAGRTVRLAERMRAGIRFLPAFLGAEGPKTYLIAMGNEADLRGPGGAPLAYGIVTVDRGRFRLVAGGGVNDLRVDPRLLAPRAPRRRVDVPLPAEVAWYIDHIRESYPWIGTVNYTPDFPVVADVWARMVRKVTGRRIDGVIQMDQTAVAGMLGTHELRLPAYPRVITGKNLVRVVSHDQYFLPLQEQLAFPGQLIVTAWPKLLDPSSLQGAAAGLGQSLAQKRIQLWSTDRKLQAELDELGWNGAVETGAGDRLYVVDDKLTPNKVDYFSRLSLHYDVKIDASGTADAVLEVTVTNDAPPGLPRTIADPAGSGSYALNRALMLAFVPRQAELVDSAPATGLPDHLEAGAKVLARILRVPAGTTATLRLHYRIPGVLISTDSVRLYRLSIQLQPRIVPADLRVSVTLPRGETIRSVPGGWSVKGNVLTLETQLTHELVQEVAF